MSLRGQLDSACPTISLGCRNSQVGPQAVILKGLGWKEGQSLEVLQFNLGEICGVPTECKSSGKIVVEATQGMAPWKLFYRPCLWLKEDKVWSL